MLEAWLREYERSPGYGTFAAVERESGEFLGWFHLRPEAGHEDEPELGYRLRRSAWGRGYATEGSRALIELAFTRLDAARVWASTMVVNVASRRVMEKAGMRLVRHFRADWPYSIPGDEEGDVEYAITRAEWETDLNPSLISEAIVLWIGSHRFAWPQPDDQRLLDAYGQARGRALINAVHALKAEFDESDAKRTAADLVAMGERAASEFHARHPEIADAAVEALAWAYTYDHK
jgi:RimJ/RimL family protein N-acetyltransferase